MKNSGFCLLVFCLFSSIAFLNPYLTQANVYRIDPTLDYVYFFDYLPGVVDLGGIITDPNPNTVSYSYYDDAGFGSGYGYSYTSLTFDMSSIGTGTNIISAKLWLDFLDLNPDEYETSAVTTNAAVNIAGISDNLFTGSPGLRAFDVKNLLISTQVTFTTTYSDPSNEGIFVSFGSPASGSAPYLEIVTADTNPVPEPATLLLFGSGLLGLAGLRKKKNIS